MPPRRHLLLAALLLPLTVRAQGTPPDVEQAAGFVRQSGVDLAAVVAGAASPAERQARLEPFLERVVDQDGIARFCLGRYWAMATPAQQAEYVRLFRQVLLHGVVNRLGDYQAGAVQVQVNTPAIRPDGTAVPTVVQRTGNKPVNITWLVAEVAGQMRIEDVSAEGMSLRMTQRSDYASFLAHHGGDVQALIDALKVQVGGAG